jgi:hypothetical protein
MPLLASGTFEALIQPLILSLSKEPIRRCVLSYQSGSERPSDGLDYPLYLDSIRFSSSAPCWL